MPSRQWLSQQATAAGSTAARSWQAVSSRSRELTSYFNPLQTLGAKQEQSDSTVPASTSGSQQASSRERSSQGSAEPVQQVEPPTRQQQPAAAAAQQLPGSAAAAAPLQPSQQQPLEEQQVRQQEQTAAATVSPNAGALQSSKASSHHSSRGAQAVFNQLRSGDSVVEVTRGQLAVLGAAASTVGAALGAVVVVLLRSGSGAAGAGST